MKLDLFFLALFKFSQIIGESYDRVSIQKDYTLIFHDKDRVIKKSMTDLKKFYVNILKKWLEGENFCDIGVGRNEALPSSLANNKVQNDEVIELD